MSDDFVFDEDGNPIQTGNPVDNDFVYIRNQLVTDDDVSDFAFIKDRGIGSISEHLPWNGIEYNAKREGSRAGLNADITSPSVTQLDDLNGHYIPSDANMSAEDGVVFIPDSSTSPYKLRAVDVNNGVTWSRSQIGATVPLPSGAGEVYLRSFEALDAATGDTNWSVSITDGDQVITDNDLVYVTRQDSASPLVSAIDPIDRSIVWNSQPTSSCGTGPIVQNGTVYVSDTNEDVYAMDTADGTTQWHRSSVVSWSESPVVGGNDTIIFVDASLDGIIALDMTTGDTLWRFSVDTRIQVGPCADDGTVYVPTAASGSNAYGQIWSIEVADGSQNWKYDRVDARNSAIPVVGTDLLYVIDDSTYVYAIDLAGGSLQWEKRLTSDTDNDSIGLISEGDYLFAACQGLYAIS